jgi:hypothetical protein
LMRCVIGVFDHSSYESPSYSRSIIDSAPNT